MKKLNLKCLNNNSNNSEPRNCKYSTGKILETSICFGFYGLSSLRDIEKIKKGVKISFSQFNQRLGGISRRQIRRFLFKEFKRIKRYKDNKICYLILDKTSFELPRYVSYGYFYYIGIGGDGDKKERKYGEEYSIAYAYFPRSKTSFLLDWERVDRKEIKSEFRASEILLQRLLKKFKSHRVRVRAIVGDKLYYSKHFFEMEGLKEVSEGFVSKPRSNSELKSELRLLKIGKESYFKEEIEYEGEKWEIYEIGDLYWQVGGYYRKSDIPQKGDYRIIKLYNPRNEKSLYYLSNTTYLVDAEEIIRIYKIRWKIENFFQVAKYKFGGYPAPKDVYRREIRVITKLIGIVYFYLYLRRRRIKLDSNRGKNIKYLIIMFIMELNLGKRIYSIDGKVTKNIPPPEIIKIPA